MKMTNFQLLDLLSNKDLENYLEGNFTSIEAYLKHKEKMAETRPSAYAGILIK